MPSLDQLHKLLALDPADAFVLYGIAQEHARLSQFSEAVLWYERCLTADPQYCYAYYHMARAQQSAGDPSAAIQTLRRGLDAARSAGDGHAASEISSFLDELT